ncbi:aspartate--tRNA ligase [Candidatus Curtissbacteria bacterium]|nr:aspartate--tRNA ligase [Candidatus Curtissbacteria bacterium]
MARTLAADCSKLIGKKVTLAGWINAVRDHGRITFFDLRDASGIIQTVTKQPFDVGPEDVVKIAGVVKKRPENLVNKNLETGAIEIEIETLEVISKSQTPPFPLDSDGLDIEESLRLKYRYLDLRRPRLQKNLRLRHQMISYMRKFLTDRNFVEIETPILTKATPEGARDFLVPSRLQPGKFYALPQSPQQYKQLLMVAGFEKYFQIARCFRDEDPRADRAYGEFSQLDLEMSFVKQEDILTLTEQLTREITEKVFGKKVLKYPFPRITHKEALEKYGADKFDMREKKDPNVLAFAFVVDFPLFEKTEDRQIAPGHHPFTAPKPEDIPLLATDPMKAKSLQHDLVCNGLEVGGGSIRITDPQVQRQVFKILGHKDAEIEEKFGHLLRAFTYGVPPHGGIAPGIERLLMVATGEENTREVIAFPMSASGQTAVMDAPSTQDPKILKELKLKVS